VNYHVKDSSHQLAPHHFLFGSDLGEVPCCEDSGDEDSFFMVVDDPLRSETPCPERPEDDELLLGVSIFVFGNCSIFVFGVSLNTSPDEDCCCPDSDDPDLSRSVTLGDPNIRS